MDRFLSMRKTLGTKSRNDALLFLPKCECDERQSLEPFGSETVAPLWPRSLVRVYMQSKMGVLKLSRENGGLLPVWNWGGIFFLGRKLWRWWFRLEGIHLEISKTRRIGMFFLRLRRLPNSSDWSWWKFLSFACRGCAVQAANWKLIPLQKLSEWNRACAVSSSVTKFSQDVLNWDCWKHAGYIHLCLCYPSEANRSGWTGSEDWFPKERSIYINVQILHTCIHLWCISLYPYFTAIR